MKGLWNTITAAVSALVSAFISLPTMIQLLVYAVSLDIVTGLIAAWTERRLSSDVGRKGVSKKALMLIATAGAEIASRTAGLKMHAPWGHELSIGAAIACYYTLQETLSIIENLSRAGAPLPEWITQRIYALLKDGGKP